MTLESGGSGRRVMVWGKAGRAAMMSRQRALPV